MKTRENEKRMITEDPYLRPDKAESILDANPAKEEAETVVGFLYSISRKGMSEYWTLHLGANTIGKGSDNDIQLMEASVSVSHATINIKLMKTTGKVIAFIRDIGSKNGIYLNETELDYEGHSCKNGDIITIGDAYKLALILIDTNELGLSPADNFKEIAAEPIQKAPIENILRKAPESDAYERKGAKNGLETIDASGYGLSDPGETRFM